MSEGSSPNAIAEQPARVGGLSRSPDDLRGLVLWISAGGILLWLLFELQRASYRPPVDLSTFLGRPEVAVVRTLLVLLAVPEVLLIGWFLLRVSLVERSSSTALAKCLRCAPTLVVGLLLTFAIGHVLSDDIALQMRLEEAGSNIWEPLPKDMTRAAD